MPPVPQMSWQREALASASGWDGEGRSPSRQCPKPLHKTSNQTFWTSLQSLGLPILSSHPPPPATGREKPQWLGLPAFPRCNFWLSSPNIYSSRFHCRVGNVLHVSSEIYRGCAQQSKQRPPPTFVLGVPHLCLLHWNPCLTLITLQLFGWFWLPSLLPPVRGALSHGWKEVQGGRTSAHGGALGP